MLIAVTPAHAQNIWQGDADSDWFNAANWSDGTVPTSTDNVNMNEAGALNDAVIDGGAMTAAEAQLMRLGPTGAAGTGSLTIDNAGVLNGGHAYIGDAAGSDYSVLVGNGSTWTAGIIFVGNEGNGDLTVQAGSSVTSIDGRIGLSEGSSGMATITGPGSLWDAGEDLYIGSSGNGTVDVLANAELRGEYVTIALGQNTTGILRVDGDGTEVNLTDYIEVGDNGTGSMEISNRAIVSSGSTSKIGFGSTGTGIVTLHDGGVWNQDGTLVVGGRGSGTLDIQDSSRVDVTGPIILTQSSGGSGLVTVEGTLDSDSYISVGQSGIGTMNIVAGGVVTSQYGIIADNHDADGSSATIDGAGAQWNADEFYIGSGGNGSLDITNGGFAQADEVEIGEGTTFGAAEGNLLVDGTGSLFIANTYMTVGLDGIGNVTIRNGGIVSDNFSRLGNSPDGVGTVNVDGAGSVWDTGQSWVGRTGSGTVNVTNGGTVESGVVQAGYGTGSTGAISIDGAGSSWDATVFYVGDVGDATLNITDGGLLTNSTGRVANGVDSTSSALIDGAGSRWDNSSSLYVGGDGTGTVTVRNGGTLEAANAHFGENAGSSGTVTITGTGSTFNIVGGASNLFVGEDGTGRLVITDGASVDGNSGTAHVGAGTDPDGSGSVLVTGSGSTWATTGTVYIGSTNDGTLTLSDGGVMDAGNVIMGASVDIDGTLNIGAAAGDGATGAGTLTTTGFALGTGDTVIVFNHDESNYDFDAFLASAGMGEHRIRHLAGMTDFGGDWSAFNGITTVEGGTLFVNGALDGIIDVTDGMLGGSGNLGLVTIASGGMLSPGNSVGTMNVTSATIDSGSGYEVELNDGGSVAGVHNDLLAVTGSATINGGTVNVTPENGTDDGTTYNAGDVYTIITAGGGVTGAFDGVTDDYSFLNFALSYDANNVFLTSSFADLCLDNFTDNQCATANALETLGGSALLTAVANLTSGEGEAIDLLSGEIHASTMAWLLEESDFARAAVSNRLHGLWADGDAAAQRGFWAEGFGAWGDIRGDRNAAGIDRDIGGLMLGGDLLASDDVRIGLMGGYSHSSFGVDGRASSGKADSYTAGMYGGGRIGSIMLSGGLAYGWHDVETSRSVGFTGFSDSLNASYDARTAQGWAEAGYRFEAGSARFEPFIGLAYVDLSTDDFIEDGGDAALDTDGNDADATFATLGLRAESDVNIGGIDGMLHGMFGWRHTFGETPRADMRFDAGGDDFVVKGVPLADDVSVIDIGFDGQIGENSSLGLSYGGQFGSGMEDHSASLKLNVSF